MADALRAGLSVGEFWDLTPKELSLCFEADVWRQKRDLKRDAWVAWHTAALCRAKRMPALRSLLGQDKARTLRGDELEKRQQEHADIVRRLGRHG